MPATVTLVTKPTADEEVRQSVVRLLQETLDEAVRGEIDTIVLILGHPDGDWSDKCSSTNKLSAAIGRLEITKHEWVVQYLKNRE